MKKIRFVFHKARFEWRNIFIKGRKIRLVDDVISIWTWPLNPFTPRYSHMSVWIRNENGDGFFTLRDPGTIYGYGELRFMGTCYTSTMRGDENGTVSRPAAGVFTKPKRWEYITFKVTDESFEEAMAWADERVRQKWSYSLKDIRRFFMPLWLLKRLKWDDPDREICSEHGEGWAIRLSIPANLTGLWITRLLVQILIRSPRRLWRDLVRRHHVATYSLATGLMVRNENGKKV